MDITGDFVENDTVQMRMAQLSTRSKQRKFFTFFPNDGPLRRELYQKHLEFFEAGAIYRERCFMAANRIGKTEGAGGYELTAHLTGLYPHWWRGRTFDHPVSAWAAGKTNETTRDILQQKLFGDLVAKAPDRPKGISGTGMIPGELIGRPTWKVGLPDLIDNIPILHSSGGYSHLGMKSYQQGAGSFEGTEKAVIWLDEEPPSDVYGECLIRTAGTTGVDNSDGIIILTFTPLLGLSNVVMSFMPAASRPTRD